MNHTPTPWEIDENDPYCISHIDYGTIADVPNEPADNEAIMAEMRDNARFIVTACNCHEELAEALNSLIRVCDRENIKDTGELANARRIVESVTQSQ